MELILKKLILKKKSIVFKGNYNIIFLYKINPLFFTFLFTILIFFYS